MILNGIKKNTLLALIVLLCAFFFAGSVYALRYPLGYNGNVSTSLRVGDATFIYDDTLNVWTSNAPISISGGVSYIGFSDGTNDNDGVVYFQTSGLDCMVLAMDDVSGNSLSVTIMDKDSINHANRVEPNVTSGNPALIVWAAGTVSDRDYVILWHDLTDGRLDARSNSWRISSSYGQYYFGSGFQSSTELSMNVNTTRDQVSWGNPVDYTVFTTYTRRWNDFALDTAGVTLNSAYFHSGGTDIVEGVAIGHDSTNAIFEPLKGVSKLVTGMGMVDRVSDPADPANGESVMWQSDGTGAGDDGDIMMKITDSGGTTKTITLIDYSTF